MKNICCSAMLVSLVAAVLSNRQANAHNKLQFTYLNLQKVPVYLHIDSKATNCVEDTKTETPLGVILAVQRRGMYAKIAMDTAWFGINVIA